MLPSYTNLILDSIAGSHLYGLADSESDMDTYSVFVSNSVKGKSFDRISDDDDRKACELDAFLKQIRMGSPQALEALFASSTTFRSDYEPFLKSIRPGPKATTRTYLKIADGFAYDNGGRNTINDRLALKNRRHALRLLLNLREILRRGRFEPELAPGQIEFLNWAGGLDNKEFEHDYEHLREYALSSF